LFLNGKSLGTKTRNIKEFPAAGLNWNLQFKEGENILISKGKTGGEKTVTDRLKINYRFTKNGKAERLKLSYTELENGNYLLTAIAEDSKGLRCLNYENKVYFQCLSGGETMKNLGTPTGSESIEMANGKASIEVKRNSKDRPLEVMVLNQSFKGTYLTIN
jgi:beta-galactosidase